MPTRVEWHVVRLMHDIGLEVMLQDVGWTSFWLPLLDKRLPPDKNNDILMKAQETITIQCNVTSSKLLCWHTTINAVLMELIWWSCALPECEKLKKESKNYLESWPFVGQSWWNVYDGKARNIKIIGSAGMKIAKKYRQQQRLSNYDSSRKCSRIWRAKNILGEGRGYSEIQNILQLW